AAQYAAATQGAGAGYGQQYAYAYMPGVSYQSYYTMPVSVPVAQYSKKLGRKLVEFKPRDDDDNIVPHGFNVKRWFDYQHEELKKDKKKAPKSKNGFGFPFGRALGRVEAKYGGTTTAFFALARWFLMLNLFLCAVWIGLVVLPNYSDAPIPDSYWTDSSLIDFATTLVTWAGLCVRSISCLFASILTHHSDMSVDELPLSLSVLKALNGVTSPVDMAALIHTAREHYEESESHEKERLRNAEPDLPSIHALRTYIHREREMGGGYGVGMTSGERERDDLDEFETLEQEEEREREKEREEHVQEQQSEEDSGVIYNCMALRQGLDLAVKGGLEVEGESYGSKGSPRGSRGVRHSDEGVIMISLCEVSLQELAMLSDIIPSLSGNLIGVHIDGSAPPTSVFHSILEEEAKGAANTLGGTSPLASPAAEGGVGPTSPVLSDIGLDPEEAEREKERERERVSDSDMQYELVSLFSSLGAVYRFRELSLRSVNLTGLACDALVCLLDQSTHLHTLDLTGCTLDQDVAPLIGASISSLRHLRHLSLYSLTPLATVAAGMPSLDALVRLTHIDMAYCYSQRFLSMIMGVGAGGSDCDPEVDIGSEVITSPYPCTSGHYGLLSSLRHLTTLNVTGCQLSAERTAHLLKAVTPSEYGGCPMLKELNVRNNTFHACTASALASCLSLSPCLTNLDISWSHLGSRLFCHLIPYITDSNLVSLNLTSCDLGDEACFRLLAALSACPTLRSLLLDYNGITLKGANKMLKEVAPAKHVSVRMMGTNPIRCSLFDKRTVGKLVTLDK
ncbi:hypothetical protein KIPB_004911, partial [Kipferlia bialata]